MLTRYPFVFRSRSIPAGKLCIVITFRVRYRSPPKTYAALCRQRTPITHPTILDATYTSAMLPDFNEIVKNIMDKVPPSDRMTAFPLQVVQNPSYNTQPERVHTETSSSVLEVTFLIQNVAANQRAHHSANRENETNFPGILRPVL